MSYMATHNKVRRVRGSARNYACITCGEQAHEWAYMGSEAEVVDGQGRRYSRDLNDYSPMCFGCHRRHDKAVITHCPKGHEYSGENVFFDQGKRKCRICVRARVRLYSRTRRAARRAA